MKSDTRIAYAEIEEILRYMPKIYVDKIPTKLREFFFKKEMKNISLNMITQKN